MSSNELRALLCPNCGAPIRHGDPNCAFCGATVVVAAATEVAVPAIADAQERIPEMRKRIEKNPYDGDAYYQLGLACLTLKFYDQAEDAFRQAKRLLPGVAAAHYFAGLATLFNSGSEILSVSEFRLRQVQEEFDTAVTLDPNLSEAQPYRDFVNGLIARNREDYAGALAPLHATVNALPSFALAWQVLAACYFQVGDYAQAIRAGKQALASQPNNAGVAYLIGAACVASNQDEQAEAWAQRLAEIRGDSSNWRQALHEIRGQAN